MPSLYFALLHIAMAVEECDATKDSFIFFSRAHKPSSIYFAKFKRNRGPGAYKKKLPSMMRVYTIKDDRITYSTIQQVNQSTSQPINYSTDQQVSFLTQQLSSPAPQLHLTGLRSALSNRFRQSVSLLLLHWCPADER